MKQLWEMLVPQTLNGKKIKKKCHRKWDAKVSEISGGLTLFKTRKGRWLWNGTLQREKMIRVRIAASPAEIKSIADLAKKHYDQQAIMYYLVSQEAFIQ